MEGKTLKAFEISFDDDIDSIGETIFVLALDITEAQVVAHEALVELRIATVNDSIRIKGINEQGYVIAPEFGFKLDTWVAKIKRALERDERDEV